MPASPASGWKSLAFSERNRRKSSWPAKRAGFPTEEAGRRRSSEDDLLLRLNHAQDLGVGRGLNPTPDERGPATCRSMTNA
jgi:hypothetical protein